MLSYTDLHSNCFLIYQSAVCQKSNGFVKKIGSPQNFRGWSALCPSFHAGTVGLWPSQILTDCLVYPRRFIAGKRIELFLGDFSANHGADSLRAIKLAGLEPWRPCPPHNIPERLDKPRKKLMRRSRRPEGLPFLVLRLATSNRSEARSILRPSRHRGPRSCVLHLSLMWSEHGWHWNADHDKIQDPEIELLASQAFIHNYVCGRHCWD